EAAGFRRYADLHAGLPDRRRDCSARGFADRGETTVSEADGGGAPAALEAGERAGKCFGGRLHGLVHARTDVLFVKADIHEIDALPAPKRALGLTGTPCTEEVKRPRIRRMPGWAAPPGGQRGQHSVRWQLGSCQSAEQAPHEAKEQKPAVS